MSIFMTAEQKPFFAGTYFPPESGYGGMGFRQLLLVISEKWKSDRAALLDTAENVVAGLKAAEEGEETEKGLDRELPGRAVRLFFDSFDPQNGGFGRAPKFPTPHNLIFLTLYSRLNSDENVFEMVKKTLLQMRRGGIFDQIGFGFSRYSTDSRFLVPHFEKMLYDNALLILAYSAAYKASGDRIFLDTAERVAAYISREMTGEEGQFYSAQDADSEGEEGKFYVWEREEILTVLGAERGRCFCEYYGITGRGNFEGKNIPNLLNGNEISDRFDSEREILYGYRRSRGKLHLDDKVLTSWNSLMICALSVLYRVTGKRPYLKMARCAQHFIEEKLTDGAVLYVSCRKGAPTVRGFLDEYAYYAAALLSLYDVTAEDRYLKRAGQICREAERQFRDKGSGGYFMCGAQNDRLITRPKETYDGAVSCGNSVMAYCLVRLAQLTGSEADRGRAEEQLAFLSSEASSYPIGHSLFLTALLQYLTPPEKITVVLSPEDSAEEILKDLPLYADVRIISEETEEYRLINGKTAYYVCRDFTCLAPTDVYH